MIHILHIVMGMALGYGLSSLIEAVVHKYVSDMPRKMLRFCKRYPRLFSAALNTFYSHHVIHHRCTFRRSHVEQFSSENERVELNRKLEAFGSHAKLIVSSRYAIELGGVGIAKYIITLALLLPLFFITLPMAVFFGLAITIWLPALMAHWVHPYLHQERALRQQSSSKFMIWLMNTHYMECVIQNHFLHHKYGGTSNFNLVLGADYVLGYSKKVLPNDWLDMRQVGLL
jgi:hypothetical protein